MKTLNHVFPSPATVVQPTNPAVSRHVRTGSGSHLPKYALSCDAGRDHIVIPTVTLIQDSRAFFFVDLGVRDRKGRAVGLRIGHGVCDVSGPSGDTIYGGPFCEGRNYYLDARDCRDGEGTRFVFGMNAPDQNELAAKLTARLALARQDAIRKFAKYSKSA